MTQREQVWQILRLPGQRTRVLNLIIKDKKGKEKEKFVHGKRHFHQVFRHSLEATKTSIILCVFLSCEYETSLHLTSDFHLKNTPTLTNTHTQTITLTFDFLTEKGMQ